MHQPEFWQSQSSSLLGLLLFPIAYIIAAIARYRMNQSGQKSNIPVICVGNFVVGGAGKTPLIHWLSQRLKQEGRSPVILTRGYGGQLKGPVCIDGSQHNSAMVGDEPIMLSHNNTVIMAKPRLKGLSMAEGKGDIILLDDGFQNPEMTKTLSIVVIDAEFGLGNGRVIPAGPLRASLNDQLEHADIIVIQKQKESEENNALKALKEKFDFHNLPIFHADILAQAELDSQRFIAFCGLGRPAKFFKTVQLAGADLVESHAFSDHHSFNEEDAEKLLQRSEALNASLITSRKDYVRLQSAASPALMRLCKQCQVLDINLHIAHGDQLIEAILGQIVATS